jgi:hypothetical protein
MSKNIFFACCRASIFGTFGQPSASQSDATDERCLLLEGGTFFHVTDRPKARRGVEDKQ